MIDIARANARMRGVDSGVFETRNIFDMEHGRDGTNLIVCIGALEHLERPERALHALWRVVNEYLIISVPPELVWRVRNLLRGRYMDAFGNTWGTGWCRVRELVLLYLLEGYVMETNLLLAVVLGRLVTVAGDLLFFCMASTARTGRG